MPHTLLLCLLFAVAVAPAAGGEVAGNTDSRAILAQQKQIRDEVVARDGRYRDLGASRRRELLGHQDIVVELLAGTATITELPEADRILVFNALEAIQGIINRAEDDSLICERSKPVGSHFPRLMCVTAKEKRALQGNVENKRRCDVNTGFCRN